MLVSFRTKGVLRHPPPLCVILKKWVHGAMVGCCVFRRQQEQLLVKVLRWQPSLAPTLWEQHDFCVSWSYSGGIVPSFWPWHCHHAVVALFLTVRYICSLGPRPCYINPDPSRHRHSALNALTKHNNFGPINSTWIKCKYEFKNFPGSCPECSDFENPNPFSITRESQCS